MKSLSEPTSRVVPLKKLSKLLNHRWYLQFKRRKASRCNSNSNKTNFFHRQFTDVDIEKNADDYRRTNTNEKISCTNNNNNNNHTTFFNDDYKFSLPTKKDSKQPVKRKSVACSVSVVLVSSLLVIFILSTVTLVWYYMGWIYGLQAIVVAIICVLGASGIWRLFGHWLYIAAVTAPRDVRWVVWVIITSWLLILLSFKWECPWSVRLCNIFPSQF